MKIIFCDSGFSPKEVDYMYAEEYKAAKEAAHATSLVSFEALKNGNTVKALKRVPKQEVLTPAIYRGWMLRPGLYANFYEALVERNIQLVNTPKQYRFCHYLPESYETIHAYTPFTRFKPLRGSFSIQDFKAELEAFGKAPIILKDYVKSQKHYWNEACFIPDASDLDQVEGVIQKFLELQGEDLNEGLVFRAFVELEALTTHSQSAMPLTKEFRLFIKDKRVISVFKYWDEGDYQDLQAPIEQFEAIIPEINSHFFTMDIAKRKNGDWIIVELGDGQVAGLPDNANKKAFYKEII